MASRIIQSKDPEAMVRRLIVGTPTRGSVRMEWVLARYGQVTPCNWSLGQYLQYVDATAPVGFMVPDAQNVIVKSAIEEGYEWLLFIEDDTIPPADAFLRLNEYMRNGDIPVVSGLYYTKSNPPEPLVYRGLGNSYYDDWKMGEKVWADGIPTGFFLCNVKVLKVMWDESPEYVTGGILTRRVFDAPARVWFDPDTHSVNTETGTSDLAWCKRVIRDDVLRRAGWPKIGKKQYPFLVDTNLFCHHIDASGVVYPPWNVSPDQLKRKK